jgi:hypothetical protein
LVSEEVRARLEELPGSVRILGDAVPLDYDIEEGVGVVRLRLREGQARRLAERDLPSLDRPIRFTVVRGGESALRADSLEALRVHLAAQPPERRAKKPGPPRGGKRRRRR